MKTKIFNLFWVFLLVIGSFTLGYTLKPKTSKRSMPPFMMKQGMTSGRFTMPTSRTGRSGRTAPPLNFNRR